MKKQKIEHSNWTICEDCKGRGKRKSRISKKARLNYQIALNHYEENDNEKEPPLAPKANFYLCKTCSGSGLVRSACTPIPDEENYPTIAIIGGGIGGVALAVACLHRGIPFTLYERDANFEARSQGYGLTLQQATKTIEGLGIFNLEEGIISTRHLVHTTQGEVLGEWGMRKWMDSESNTNPKRTNIHIARQSLRLKLIEQLGGSDKVQWGHQLIDFKESKDQSVELKFEVNGKIKSFKSDLVVGADGIRSTVRKQLIGEENTPLRYLDCIVILGICPLEALKDIKSDLLDSATVFQTANGNERIYMMPYDSNSIMWQLSFPMPENEAKTLSSKGSLALKEEACRRTQWHKPIPQILAATKEAQISGYPVYDRELLKPELLQNGTSVTLIGDAAHPMSPFKGQGANQALIDALALARGIFKECGPYSQWRENGLRKTVLTEFESEMLERSASKVKDSAKAAEFLHSNVVLHKGDEPRGRILKRKNKD